MVELQDIIPSGSSILSWFGGSFSVITVILIGLLISIVFGFIIYFIILSRKFKYKIEVWERVGNLKDDMKYDGDYPFRVVRLFYLSRGKR